MMQSAYRSMWSKTVLKWQPLSDENLTLIFHINLIQFLNGPRYIIMKSGKANTSKNMAVDYNLRWRMHENLEYQNGSNGSPNYEYRWKYFLWSFSHITEISERFGYSSSSSSRGRWRRRFVDDVIGWTKYDVGCFIVELCLLYCIAYTAHRQTTKE